MKSQFLDDIKETLRQRRSNSDELLFEAQNILSSPEYEASELWTPEERKAFKFGYRRGCLAERSALNILSRSLELALEGLEAYRGDNIANKVLAKLEKILGTKQCQS